jgi:hypothetical protein
MKNNRSITIIGQPVQEVYMIREINMDRITLDQYDVDCRGDIESSWSSNEDDKIFEIILKEKRSVVTLPAKATIIEQAPKLIGKIIKNFNTERTKKGRKTFICGFDFFEEKKD